MIDPVLLTARLSLRRPTSDDIAAIFAIHHDPLTTAHNPSDALASIAEATERLRRWDEHWRRFGVGYWTVRRREVSKPDAAAGSPRQPVGFCGLKMMRLHDREVLNLFYRFASPSWGDGLASEAATAVVGWGAEHFGGYPLIARVRPENIASHRVALRAGLARAETLDGPGYDGLDWIYTSRW